jgi:hypothetical protein
VDHLTARAPAFGVAQLRVLGGAMARVPEDATAYAHRRRRIMINVAALYETVAEAPVHEQWVKGFASTLQRGDGGAYVNFLAADGPSRMREAYPGGTWDRLVRIKRRYDPQNLFHRNQNIPPGE